MDEKFLSKPKVLTLSTTEDMYRRFKETGRLNDLLDRNIIQENIDLLKLFGFQDEVQERIIQEDADPFEKADLLHSHSQRETYKIADYAIRMSFSNQSQDEIMNNILTNGSEHGGTPLFISSSGHYLRYGENKKSLAEYWEKGNEGVKSLIGLAYNKKRYKEISGRTIEEDILSNQPGIAAPIAPGIFSGSLEDVAKAVELVLIIEVI